MKKNIQDFMQEFTVPNTTEKEITATIYKSKQALRHAPLEKTETSVFKQMWLIIRFHFPKTLLLQVLLSIVLCLFLFQHNIGITKDINGNAITLYQPKIVCLAIGGILFSVVTVIELLRNRLSDLWESEKVCAIRLEKIIAFKLSILTIFTSIILLILCTVLAKEYKDLSILPLFSIAFLPYLCITTCLIQFNEVIQGWQGLFTIYAGMTLFFIGLLNLPSTILLWVLLDHGALLLPVPCVICLFILIQKLAWQAER